MKIMSKLLAVLLVIALILPVYALEMGNHSLMADPLPQAPECSAAAVVQAEPRPLAHPGKSEIAAKWETVTDASTLFAEEPVVAAPYVAGALTEDFLESGITYLNYVRFVAGLPEVTLDATMNLDAQHGAVVLAAIDELTHYPKQPADMDYAFYKRGYDATTSSNISARYGYAPLTCLKGAVEGCMNDNNSLNNLTTVGHRRWLLNPALGKVGFGYAEAESGWRYIVNKVHDRTGAGCDFDYISWPVAGNHPTNLFDAQNPWSVTLNTRVYKNVSAKYVNITVTRKSDGKVWTFDRSTGAPNIDQSDYYNPHIDSYLTVDTQWYGLPNCIIFHPGTDNVDSYEGVYHVKITGIYYTDGTPAEIEYDVDFFDIDSVSCGHSYTAVVTAPTCQAQGYTTYTCTMCGDSYVGDYTDPVDHSYEEGTCIWCGEETYTIQWLSGTTSLNGTIDLNIYVALSENLLDEEDAFIRFTHSGITVDVPVSEGIEDMKKDTVCYRYSCEIFAKQVADTVTVQVMKGDEVIGDTLEYSVMKYCLNQIKKSTNQELVAVCKAMLNYAAASQLSFDYNTDNLANASLSDADKVLPQVDASAYKYSITGTEEGIKASSATLMLESEVKIRVYFKLTGDKSIDEYTFYIDGREVEVQQNDKGYYIETDGIAAKHLEQMHEFCVGGITVNYGALSYVNSKLTSSKETELNKNLAKALYAYWQAAESYLG